MSIRLSSARFEEIKRIVTKMFIDYDVSCVPISGFEIAIKMGVKVIPYSSIPAPKRYLLIKKSQDGFCVERAPGEWYIYYNDAESNYGRINNTIMHEIGHIVLDHSEDSELAEAEVKFFAKYALVPPALLHYMSLDNAEDIAKIFDVSREAARYAYSYYKKWLNFGGRNYTDYELIQLRQFHFATG